MALNAIIVTAIVEIRQHRGKRIRFEFNALPDGRNQIMVVWLGVDAFPSSF
jgi:hypothetical protein